MGRIPSAEGLTKNKKTSPSKREFSSRVPANFIWTRLSLQAVCPHWDFGLAGLHNHMQPIPYYKILSVYRHILLILFFWRTSTNTIYISPLSTYLSISYIYIPIYIHMFVYVYMYIYIHTQIYIKLKQKFQETISLLHVIYLDTFFFFKLFFLLFTRYTIKSMFGTLSKITPGLLIKR